MDKRILILKQLTGDISLEDRNQLNDWLQEAPQNVEIKNQIRADWRMSKEAKEPIGFDVNKGVREIQALIKNFKKDTVKDEVRGKVKPTPNRKPLKIPFVPILICLSLVGLLFFTYKFFPKSKDAPVVERKLTTMLGEVRSHMLPDQSKIWLNAKSGLRYVEDASNTNLNIFFNGEGYFEINSKVDQQTIIRLPKMIIKAKEAHFNISNKESISFAEILVSTGEIAIHALDDQLIQTLTSRQVGKYYYDEKRFEPDSRFNPNITSWKSKKLIFNNVALSQAIKDMEHYFDREILLTEKKLESCMLSATYEKPDINRILSKLASKYQMQLTQGVHGDYVLRRGRCD